MTTTESERDALNEVIESPHGAKLWQLIADKHNVDIDRLIDVWVDYMENKG